MEYRIARDYKEVNTFRNLYMISSVIRYVILLLRQLFCIISDCELEISQYETLIKG